MSEDTEQDETDVNTEEVYSTITCKSGYVINLNKDGKIICPNLSQYVDTSNSKWCQVEFDVHSGSDNRYSQDYYYYVDDAGNTGYRASEDNDNFSITEKGVYSVTLCITGNDTATVIPVNTWFLVN